MTPASLSPERLDELRRVAEAAKAYPVAPGAWKAGRAAQVWGPSLKGGETHLVDVRGWGYLTGHGHGALKLDEKTAASHQDALAAHIAALDPPTALALLSDHAALVAKVEALRAAISWIEPPFVDEATPADELRKRIKFVVTDAARAQGAPK